MRPLLSLTAFAFVEQRLEQLTGNESVPIQMAQCWFPGLAIINAKYKYIFFK